MRRPSSVRTGMFWRLGSVEARRPVAEPGDLVGGVDAPRVGVDRVLEGVGVGRLELRQHPPVEDAGREVVALRRQLLQHVGAGAPGAGLAALAALQAHALEEDLAELLRRADVELLAGEGLDLVLQRRHALREVPRQPRERGAVDLDAMRLHRREHGDERALHGLVDPGDAGERQARLQRHPQPQDDLRLLAEDAGGLLGRELGEGAGGLAAAEDRLHRGRDVAEVVLREVVDRIGVLRGVERVGDEHGVVDRREGDAVTGEELGGGLDVVADLEGRRVLEDRAQDVERLPERNLAGGGLVEEVAVARGIAGDVGERQVGGLAGVGGEGDADGLGAHLVAAARLDREGDEAALGDAGDKRREAGGVADEGGRGPGRSAAARPARGRQRRRGRSAPRRRA